MAKQSRHVAARLLAYIALIALSFWSAGAHTQNSTQSGEWTMAGKDYANTRFSELGEITTSNVKNLRLAFSFSTGSTKGHEAGPLVVGSTMYIKYDADQPSKMFTTANELHIPVRRPVIVQLNARDVIHSF